MTSLGHGLHLAAMMFVSERSQGAVDLLEISWLEVIGDFAVVTMLCFWILAFRLFLFLVNPEITVRGEQRVTLKFLCKSGASPIECWRQLHQVWGDRTMSKTQIRAWHKRFKQGIDAVADLPRTGRPQTARTDENVQMIKGMIDGDGSLSIAEMSSRTGISHPIVCRIVREDLQMTQKCAKFIPRELTDAQNGPGKQCVMTTFSSFDPLFEKENSTEESDSDSD